MNNFRECKCGCGLRCDSPYKYYYSQEHNTAHKKALKQEIINNTCKIIGVDINSLKEQAGIYGIYRKHDGIYIRITSTSNMWNYFYNKMCPNQKTHKLSYDSEKYGFRVLAYVDKNLERETCLLVNSFYNKGKCTHQWHERGFYASIPIIWEAIQNGMSLADFLSFLDSYS